MSQFRDNLPLFREMNAHIPGILKKSLAEAGIIVASVESRIKEEGSLRGKLLRKGDKYRSLSDITDLLGVRIITFYIDDVDKVASLVERLFDIDWDNSIDKRKILRTDTFGYLSLHYICSIPEAAGDAAGLKDAGKFRFEVQMRTLLQHAWANMNHDTGYKSGVEVPNEYLRNMNRLAGMLELADEQFSRIRTDINNYRRRVQALVASGNLSEVPLDGDSFRSYLATGPFDALNRKIAAINQAEIQEVPLMPFLPLFKGMGMQTLGDIGKMVKRCSDGAYQIACYQLSLTDLDIVASSIGPQNLCIAYILLSGGGTAGLKYMFDTLNGPSESNQIMAGMLVKQASDMPFMNQNLQMP